MKAQIAQCEHLHLRVLPVDAVIGGGPDRDMVAMLAVIVEQFLHRDADRRAAAPDADEMRRSEAAVDHLHAQPQRVGEQVIRVDEDFVVAHGAGVIPPLAPRKRDSTFARSDIMYGIVYGFIHAFMQVLGK
jgi:hypothetical protein